MSSKERLDILLVQKGLFPSREKAKRAIMEGLVYVDKAISDKPGMPVRTDAQIFVKDTCPYVGRGGLKLEKALEKFDIDLTGKVCMDVGASTGGFTDCMLAKGAVKVYAVDVGYGQLAWKLRNDERVINIEKCNFRYFDSSLLDEVPEFLTIDVSFISLYHILPVAFSSLKPDGSLVALIKPQFEAGREEVSKNGLILDPKVHENVIKKVVNMAEDSGFIVSGLDYSPIRGAKGNIEYLLYLNKAIKISYNINDSYIHDVVKVSHEEL
jgi:23S rRNA (cytidine1920-2'-O)/16S rRNA (cytidine1409-2'-O)-methyltransferase